MIYILLATRFQSNLTDVLDINNNQNLKTSSLDESVDPQILEKVSRQTIYLIPYHEYRVHFVTWRNKIKQNWNLLGASTESIQDSPFVELFVCSIHNKHFLRWLNTILKIEISSQCLKRSWCILTFQRKGRWTNKPLISLLLPSMDFKHCQNNTKM